MRFLIRSHLIDFRQLNNSTFKLPLIMRLTNVLMNLSCAWNGISNWFNRSIVMKLLIRSHHVSAFGRKYEINVETTTKYNKFMLCATLFLHTWKNEANEKNNVNDDNIGCISYVQTEPRVVYCILSEFFAPSDRQEKME
jgi:hypothetical protein